MNQKFPKHEKLKSSKTISGLFSEGKGYTQFPIRILVKPNTDYSHNRIAFSVPKRKFKSAVDRNRIKRQLREIYRLNKYRLQSEEHKFWDMLIIFTGNKLPEYAALEKSMLNVFASIASSSNFKQSSS